MRREGRCHVRRQDSSDTGTATTPTTTDTNTNKINPSSATDLTSPGPVVGVRNDGQQEPSSRRALSPYEGADDLNSEAAIALDGALFLEGEGRPTEITAMIGELRAEAD